MTTAEAKILYEQGLDYLSRQLRSRAIKYFQRAADLGHTEAARHLQRLHRSSITLSASQWRTHARTACDTNNWCALWNEITQAAQANDIHAMRYAALLLSTSTTAQTHVYSLLSSAVALGDKPALHLLGIWLHENGYTEQARHYWQRHNSFRSQQWLTEAGVAKNGPSEIPLPLNFDFLPTPNFIALSKQPGTLNTFDHVFSRLQCEYLILVAEPFLHQSLVLNPDTGERIPDTIRTSHNATLPNTAHDPVILYMRWQLANAGGVNEQQGEYLSVLRYLPGQEYKPHIDYFLPSVIQRHNGQQRIATSICYLNDNFSGGETTFPLWQKSVSPQTGRIAHFRNTDDNGQPDRHSLHAGTPVQTGCKWLVTLWIRDGVFKEM